MIARSQKTRSTTRARYDAQARRLGYDGVVDLLIRTDSWREDRLADMLGVSASTAGRIRHVYLPAPPSTSTSTSQRRAAQYRQSAAARHDERARAAGYADLADLLAANRTATIATLATLLSVSPSTAHRLRNYAPPDGKTRRGVGRSA